MSIININGVAGKTFPKKFEASKIIKDVMEDNGYTEINKETVVSIVNEFNSRLGVGLDIEVEGKKVKTVTGVKVEDFWILNLYTEIEFRSNEVLRGFGYAKNLNFNDLSEWGCLFTPLNGEI